MVKGAIIIYYKHLLSRLVYVVRLFYVEQIHMTMLVLSGIFSLKPGGHGDENWKSLSSRPVARQHANPRCAFNARTYNDARASGSIFYGPQNLPLACVRYGKIEETLRPIYERRDRACREFMA